MTEQDVSLMLAVLGGLCLTAVWIGHRTGDAPRDSLLMMVLGCAKLALAFALPLA